MNSYYLGLDLAIFTLIYNANFAIFLMFLLRVKKKEWARYPAAVFNILGIPAFIISMANLSFGREWWFWAIPFLFFGFTVLSVILDYLMKINFREPKRYGILVPYLVLFYVSLILMWGVTWSIGVVFGGMTGITYFLQLGGAAYAGKNGVG